jgi:A118 family predicted phage portal protein
MPLPSNNPDWPPKELAEAMGLYEKWDAWWSGNTSKLARVYANSVGYANDPPLDRGQERRGSGLGRLLTRMFWGVPPSPGALRSAKLHVPLAADISGVSADLLFGEPPTFNAPQGKDAAAGSEATQDRLDTMLADGGLPATLLEAADVCAAFGGVYLRIGWDQAVADHVLIDAIPPDAAVPTFRSGRLVSVIFWKELPALPGDARTWRHLEMHEPGSISHALYATGDSARLGTGIDLSAHPATEQFAALVGAGGKVATGAKGLTAEYVPNMKPHRRLRGSQLGRSDYDGIEPMMDALDEAWTSWMRDLRLGKGRLVVPDVYLHDLGAGKGTVFDAEQEIYQQVHALPGGEGLAMQVVQFAIRVAEHQQTTEALTSQALRGAGYSVQTFGEGGDVVATATEVVARERRSYTTRTRKIDYWRPVLRRLLYTALQVDVSIFHTKGVVPEPPHIEWPDGVAVDPQAQATTLQLLAAAEAVSTRTKVEMLHPDWKPEQVDEEVKAIQAAAAPPPPPPGAGTDGFPVPPVTGAPEDTTGGGARANTGDTTAETPPARAKTPATAGNGRFR